MTGESFIDATAFSSGNAGDIFVQAGSLLIDGTGAAPQGNLGIFAESQGSGNAGTVTLDIDGAAIVKQGGQISSSTFFQWTRRRHHDPRGLARAAGLERPGLPDFYRRDLGQRGQWRGGDDQHRRGRRDERDERRGDFPARPSAPGREAIFLSTRERCCSMAD